MRYDRTIRFVIRDGAGQFVRAFDDVCRPLQHAPAASVARPTRTQQPRCRRTSAWPADPTTHHVQRTRQRVPPSSLNQDNNGQPRTHATSATTRPLPHPAIKKRRQDDRPRPRTRFRHPQAHSVCKPDTAAHCSQPKARILPVDATAQDPRVLNATVPSTDREAPAGTREVVATGTRGPAPKCRAAL